MITEQLINNADEKVKSLFSENKKLWCCIYILIFVSIVFGLILLYFIFKFKNKISIKYLLLKYSSKIKTIENLIRVKILNNKFELFYQIFDSSN